MKKLLQFPLFALILLGLSACTTASIRDVNNSNFAAYGTDMIKHKKLTMDEFAEVILKSGQANKWIMTIVEEGKINGTLVVKSHSATVLITYKPDLSYKIEYVSSVNLKEKDGKIHKNYNKWVIRLDKRIQDLLTRALIDKRF